ncbi:hypothetical protein BLNAU_6076 [Blattamonas nauphoetae]|uniref:Uncharacterized protein n=1 Tax=Blattamonas nauphoetae TaxID=2049346 RepID=A0ABQ9Y504_9EUKA|nr:hypothetical protein BLNAU_6076 [Blattamonas nauphoetae]
MSEGMSMLFRVLGGEDVAGSHLRFEYCSAATQVDELRASSCQFLDCAATVIRGAMTAQIVALESIDNGASDHQLHQSERAKMNLSKLPVDLTLEVNVTSSETPCRVQPQFPLYLEISSSLVELTGFSATHQSRRVCAGQFAFFRANTAVSMIVLDNFLLLREKRAARYSLKKAGCTICNTILFQKCRVTVTNTW